MCLYLMLALISGGRWGERELQLSADEVTHPSPLLHRRLSVVAPSASAAPLHPGTSAELLTRAHHSLVDRTTVSA